jgi:hypothetical protein
MMQPDPKQPGGDSLRDALKEVEQGRQKKLRDQRRARKRDRWFGWTRRLPGGIEGLLFAVVVIFILLIGDGVRREGQELTARIAATRGQVMLQKAGVSSSVTAAVNTTLHEGDQIFTIRDGEATLVFPDGSALLVEPNTRLEVRVLGFSRGEVRDRSFLVHFGGVVAHFSRQFGQGSRGAVSSPTAVAAVRGTGFRVFYDPDPTRKQTYLAVVEGTVQFRTTAGANQVIPNQFCVATGPRILPTHSLPRPAQQRIAAQLQALRQYERPPSFLESLETRINDALNPLLQLLGIAPGVWSYQAVDFARVAACREALHRLGTRLESREAPDTLNPITLEELQLDAAEREKLLHSFSGAMLESYRKTGKNQYVLRVRARDQKHTLFELTRGSVREVKE